jgi:hypothetical protein
MSSTLTTQVLIDRVQHGNPSSRVAALNELCARYQERVLRAVRIRLGAKLRAKLQSSDVVQDVMAIVQALLVKSPLLPSRDAARAPPHVAPIVRLPSHRRRE